MSSTAIVASSCNFLKNAVDLKSSPLDTTTPFFTFFAYSSPPSPKSTSSDCWILRSSRIRFAFSSYAARSRSSFSSCAFLALFCAFFVYHALFSPLLRVARALSPPSPSRCFPSTRAHRCCRSPRALSATRCSRSSARPPPSPRPGPSS